MGCCDMSFLGCCSLCDFPSFGWCPWSYRRLWILCWIKCLCVGHDIFLDARYAYIHSSSCSYILINFLFLYYRNETQRTLEELDYVFAVPTSRHVSYQAKTFLPYWIKRYIFFPNVELEPLYNFDEVESVTVFEKGVGH